MLFFGSSFYASAAFHTYSGYSFSYKSRYEITGDWEFTKENSKRRQKDEKESTKKGTKENAAGNRVCVCLCKGFKRRTKRGQAVGRHAVKGRKAV